MKVTTSGFLLFCIFLVLKLTDTIDWSWWWVTAPVWGSWVLVIVGAIVLLVAEEYNDGRGQC